MDFRRNSSDFSFDALSPEAYEYLQKSRALHALPIERLQHMNPDAIKLYEEHGINLVAEPLEIAVCAQHNNGGLAANHWWESLNIKHLFPVGEVNGSHGVYRPGGSALNSGQVAGFRAADYIANCYKNFTLDDASFYRSAQQQLDNLTELFRAGTDSSFNWSDARAEFQGRMTKYGSHIRSQAGLKSAVVDAWNQYHQLIDAGICRRSATDTVESIRNLQLCFAHAVYLEAILTQVNSGVGSRGSALVMSNDGIEAHSMLGDEWRFSPENESFRDKVLETVAESSGKVNSNWVQRRKLPECNAWFENAWADYRNGVIYQHKVQ
jgi:aspartate oxidase